MMQRSNSDETPAANEIPAELGTDAKAAEAVSEASDPQSEAPPRRLLEDQYEVGEVIGDGHFATVRRGRHRASGTEVAIKELKRGADAHAEAAALKAEIAILRRVGSHPNIVQLHEVIESEEGCFIVMELVTGGELFERLSRHGAYSEKEASALFAQIGEAIRHLHAQGLCHRDLKPENVLLSAPAQHGHQTVKICDFGLSVALEHGHTLRERQGTWAYWAPELFDAAYGKEVDMWALGCLLYTILSGRHPFDAAGRSDLEMQQCIQDVQFDFEHEVWDGVSSEAKQLVTLLLQREPAKRLDAEGLLNHPWIRGEHVSSTPMPHSDRNLHEYQQMRRKWKAALVASCFRQAALRKRHSGRREAELFYAGGHRAVGAQCGGDGSQETSTADEAREPEHIREERTLLADAFNEFDPQGRGYVLASEMPEVILRLGQRVTEDEVQQMLHAMDPSNSGRIHYEGYLNMAAETVKDHTRFFQKGTTIFREGEPSDYFYLILAGRVRRSRTNPIEVQATQATQRLQQAADSEGQPQLLRCRSDPPPLEGAAAGGPSSALALPKTLPGGQDEDDLIAGDYFGTSAILGGKGSRRHATMLAMSDVHALALCRDDFEAGHSSSLTPRLSARLSRAGATSADRSLRFIDMMGCANERRRLRKGEVLFREGEVASDMFIIRQGTVEVSFLGRDERKHVIVQRGRGECCGETSCLQHKPRNSTISCVSDEGCEVLCVSRADFLELVRSSWDVYHDLTAVADRHFKEKQRRVNFRRTQDEAMGIEDEPEDGNDAV